MLPIGLTLTRFPINSLYTPLVSTALHSVIFKGEGMVRVAFVRNLHAPACGTGKTPASPLNDGVLSRSQVTRQAGG